MFAKTVSLFYFVVSLTTSSSCVSAKLLLKINRDSRRGWSGDSNQAIDVTTKQNTMDSENVKVADNQNTIQFQRKSIQSSIGNALSTNSKLIERFALTMKADQRKQKEEQKKQDKIEQVRKELKKLRAEEKAAELKMMEEEGKEDQRKKHKENRRKNVITQACILLFGTLIVLGMCFAFGQMNEESAPARDPIQWITIAGSFATCFELTKRNLLRMN